MHVYQHFIQRVKCLWIYHQAKFHPHQKDLHTPCMIIESVDSVSGDGPDTPYIYNALQIPKYLKTGNFIKFLSIKIRISSKLYI